MDDHAMAGSAPDASLADVVNVPPQFVPMRLVAPEAALAVDLDRPEMILGRHSDADVRLPLPDVSRRHCRFAYMNGQWHVWDLNSLNGIYVNGARVNHAVLRGRDTLAVGGFLFEVRLSDEELPRQAPGTGEASYQILSGIVECLPRQTMRIDYGDRRAS